MGKFIDKVLDFYKEGWNAGKETIKKGIDYVTGNTKDLAENTREKFETIADEGTTDESSSTEGNSTENQIQDTTNESIGENSVIPIGGSFDLNALKEMQKEQWAREDEIRKETQAREDSAYQRTVEDMKKAGINPNLMNVQPAASGGGITSATGIDYNGAQIEVEKYLTEIENMLDRELKADENQKDRLSDLLRGVITAAAIFFR